MTAKDLIDAYLTEIRRVNGDEYSDLVRLWYRHGWFYLRAPWRNGSKWVANYTEKPLRRTKLISMIETLKQRETKGTEQCHT